MVWIIILIFLFLILSWLFLAPLELQIDTRIPRVSLQWISIGSAIVVFKNDRWWLSIRILVFHKQWDLEKLIFAEKKKKKRPKRPKQKRKTKWLRKFFPLLKTFRVTKWQIAIDTNDCIKNAWLYALNFSPYTRQHMYINFIDENYLVLQVRNAPWKLAFAFMR